MCFSNALRSIAAVVSPGCMCSGKGAHSSFCTHLELWGDEDGLHSKGTLHRAGTGQHMHMDAGVQQQLCLTLRHNMLRFSPYLDRYDPFAS